MTFHNSIGTRVTDKQIMTTYRPEFLTPFGREQPKLAFLDSLNTPPSASLFSQ